MTIWIPDAPETFAGAVLVPFHIALPDPTGTIFLNGQRLTGGVGGFALNLELQGDDLTGTISDDGVRFDSVRLRRYRPAHTDVTGTWVSLPAPGAVTLLDTLRIKADGRLWSSSRIFQDGQTVFSSNLFGYYQRQGTLLRIRYVLPVLAQSLSRRDSLVVSGDTLVRTRYSPGVVIQDRLTRRLP